MAIKFDVQTGQVFVRNFDQGVVETLGGYVDTAQGGSKRTYFIDIPAADPMKVPVIWNKPRQAMEAKILPSILITRLDVRPNLTRWHSIAATQYRIGVGPLEATTLPNGDTVSGYAEYEQLVQAFPFDLIYSIQVQAFYEHEAIPMVKKILSVYKPYSKINLIDSLSSERTYSVFQENGFSDVSEILDVHDRMKAYSIEIRVEGELDLSDPEINSSALEIITNIHRV